MAGGLPMRLREAGDLVAEEARVVAAPWSKQVPPSIEVHEGADAVIVSSGVGPSYPNEVKGVRHPVFGHDAWVTNEFRPFLAPAVDAKAGQAAEVVAKVVDDWGLELGYRNAP
jgi:hypothetical protein